MKKIILSVVIVLFGASLFSCKRAPKKDEVWEAYSEAQKNFQHETYKVMSSKLPDDSELLAKYRDYSLVGIEEQKMKFNYVLTHHPERIIRDKKLYDFVHFEWTNADREALHKSNPEAAELEKRRSELWREIRPHWDQLRERMEIVYKSEEYNKIQKQHRIRSREFEDMLKKEHD